VTEKKAFIINFDRPLPDIVIEDVKKNYPDIKNLIVIDKKVSINLRKKIYMQCVDIRAELERDYDGIFSGFYPIIVNLPGFSIGAVYLINEIEARIKSKPLILEMIKHKEKGSLFTEFEYRRVLDLEFNNKVTKNNIQQDYN
jgi:hypothetical protein